MDIDKPKGLPSDPTGDSTGSPSKSNTLSDDLEMRFEVDPDKPGVFAPAGN